MLPQVGYQPITLASPRSSTDSLDIMGEEPMHEPVRKPRTPRWRRLHSTFSFRVKILLGGLAIVLVLLVILIPYFFTTFRKAGGVVDLGYAQYQGQKLKGGITQTLGIRYAAPPVGNLRFAAPQDPVTNRKKVQAGNKHGNRCMGTGARRVVMGTSEDCLFLDVFAPTDVTDDSRLPVFFWIQGGGFNANTNSNYNGAGLIQAANYNMVVVTLNYRVGPYGFLASQEVESQASLNNGLKDQIKALQWVQKYIEKFGGDPDHVVIGGDSAGGASVTLLMAAYGGRNDGLFHAAAAESQSFAAVLNVTESQFMYDALVTRSRCNNNPSFTSTLACLRSLPAAQMQRYNIGIPFPSAPEMPLFPYNPTLDYDLIPDLTISLFRSGRYIRVPSIFGDVTNEGTIFTPKNASNRSDVARFLKSQFPAITTNQTDTLNDMYPDTGPRFPFSGSYWRPLSDSYGELRYICPGLFLSRTLAADNVTALSNWNYRYDVQDPLQEARGFGVPHVSDVYAIWGPKNTHGGAPPSLTGKNANIIPVIQGYWTSFIRSFDPNTYRVPGSPRWELFTEQEQGRILFQTNETRMESVPQAQRDRCAYMDSIALSIQQ